MPPKLLIVDDIADSRALLSRPFSRRGIDVVEAKDGETALRLIEAEGFDAALLDISMPGLNGIEVLREIRVRHAEASLPVIMVTGHTESAEVTHAFRLGASDYVTKPIDIPVLVARVLTQIRRKQAEDRLQQALADLARVNFELRQESARRAESEARAWDLAHHDPLTGVSNRLRFWDRVSASLHAMGDDQTLALLCLDLDGFKEVNDTLGHQVGDELLKAIANRMRGCLGDRDTLARLGGDEFAILQPAVSGPGKALEVAERLIEVVSMPVAVGDREVKVGCSVGIALATDGTIEPDLLFRQADTALYAAKSSGRGTWRQFEGEAIASARARQTPRLANALSAGFTGAPGTVRRRQGSRP